MGMGAGEIGLAFSLDAYAGSRGEQPGFDDEHLHDDEVAMAAKDADHAHLHDAEHGGHGPGHDHHGPWHGGHGPRHGSRAGARRAHGLSHSFRMRAIDGRHREEPLHPIDGAKAGKEGFLDDVQESPNVPGHMAMLTGQEEKLQQ